MTDKGDSDTITVYPVDDLTREQLLRALGFDEDETSDYKVTDPLE